MIMYDHIVLQDACRQALLCVASGPNRHRRGVVRGCSWREVVGVHRCTMVSVCVNRHELESNLLRSRTCEDEVGFFIVIVLFRLYFSARVECRTSDRRLQRCRADMCCRYMLEGRNHFGSEEAASSISISVDAGRIGKRNRMLMALAMPSNMAMWAPPQVCHETYSNSGSVALVVGLAVA